MSRKSVIGALVTLLVAAIAIVTVGTRRATVTPAMVNFIGFTNGPSGVPVAQFQIRNQSKQRIARNGYCRRDGTTVDIASTKLLAAGDSEVVEVPLEGGSSNRVSEVRFNGVRDFGSLESAVSDVADLLRKVGIGSDWLDTTERRRWEVGAEIRVGNAGTAPNPNAAPLQQPDAMLRK